MVCNLCGKTAHLEPAIVELYSTIKKRVILCLGVCEVTSEVCTTNSQTSSS